MVKPVEEPDKRQFKHGRYIIGLGPIDIRAEVKIKMVAMFQKKEKYDDKQLDRQKRRKKFKQTA